MLTNNHHRETVLSSCGQAARFKNRKIRVMYQGRFRNGKEVDNRYYTLPEAEARRKAARTAYSFGISGTIFMPDPRPANGVVARESDFPCHSDSHVRSGVEADGARIREGQSVFLVVRDCPVVVMAAPRGKHAVVAHAGRASLVNEGVIDAMVDALSLRSADMLGVEVGIFLAISPDHFEHDPNHPEYGERNREMIDFIRLRYGSSCFSDIATGRLDLVELIRRQCARAGILDQNIWSDGIDPFSARLIDGRHAFYSHRRGDIEGGNVVIATIA